MTETVTRDDIEAKLKELQGEAQTTARTSVGYVVAAAAVVGVVAIAAAFVLGRRKGRKSRTLVEVRRA